MMPSPEARADERPPPVGRHRRAWAGPAVALAAFAASAITHDDPGITIDEPRYVRSAAAMRGWLGELVGARSRADLVKVFSREGIRRGWTCHYQGDHAHPPGLQYLHNLMYVLTAGMLDEPGPGRLGGAILLGLSAWALMRLVGERHGLSAGLGAAVMLVTMPRVFGHAHLAATDFPLLAGWLLSTFAWLRAAERRRWAIALVGILALTLLVKFTALGLFLPLWLWTLIYRRSRWRRFLLLCLLAGLLALALDPPMWHDPVHGLVRYARQSLGRRHFLPIPAYYQGRTYPFSLPWHNGLVLTAITVPAAVLGLSLVGLAAVAARRFRDPFGTLCVTNVGLFLAVRALPTPGHDGVRLFLPIFAFVAGLAGIGLAAIGRLAARLVRAHPLRMLGQAGAVLALLGYGLVQVQPIHPFELSYYNELVGGLSGAVRRGYQATYWYDALTREMYGKMGKVLPQGARVLLIPRFPAVADLAKRRTWLRADIEPVGKPPADFVLLLFRQEWLNERVRALHRGEVGERLLVQAYDGVPLVALYRHHVAPPPVETRRAEPARAAPAR